MAIHFQPLADHSGEVEWRADRELELLRATISSRHATFWINFLCWVLLVAACALLPNKGAFLVPLALRLASMIVTMRLSTRLHRRIEEGSPIRSLMGAIQLNLVVVGMSWALLLTPILSEESRHPAHLVIGFGTFVIAGSVLTTLSALRGPFLAFGLGFFLPLVGTMARHAHGADWEAVGALVAIFIVVLLYTKAGGQQRVYAAESVVENRRLGAHLAALLAKAEHNALHDPLTGLYNRRALFEAHLISPEDRRRKHVLLVDLDHFKKLNDDHGHDTGDRVLRGVAEGVGGVIGALPGDEHFAVRLGGEEFAVVLFLSDPDRAHEVAERIRFAIALVGGKVGLKGQKTTASIGLTHFDCGENIDDVFARADKAMYRAKSSGRNQVRRHAANAA